MINGSGKKWWDQVEREYQNHSIFLKVHRYSTFQNNSFCGHVYSPCEENYFKLIWEYRWDLRTKKWGIMFLKEEILPFQVIDCINICVEYSKIVSYNFKTKWSLLLPVTFLHLDYIVCDNTELIPPANVSGPVWWWIFFVAHKSFVYIFIIGKKVSMASIYAVKEQISHHFQSHHASSRATHFGIQCMQSWPFL